MTQIDNLTNFSVQETALLLEDGTSAIMGLVFNGATQRWVMSMQYGTKTINSIGLCTYPNMLRQWKNIFPFGIAVATSDQTDPFTVDDFISGRVKVYLLNAADVIGVEQDIFTAP